MWPLIRARWCWRTRPGGRPVRRSSPPSPPPLVRTSLFGLSSSSITLSLSYLPDTNIFDFARNILFFFPLPWFDSTNDSQSPKLWPGVVRETESPGRLPRSSCVAAQRRPFVLWAWDWERHLIMLCLPWTSGLGCSSCSDNLPWFSFLWMDRPEWKADENHLYRAARSLGGL